MHKLPKFTAGAESGLGFRVWGLGFRVTWVLGLKAADAM